MALAKKYAGLPDLDVAQEIYETPALTDDASTIQTDTLRTDSPTPSDEGGDERLIRQRIDADSARRRFEPTLVDAKGVNFSDTIEAGGRRSYRTRSRRRRRRDHDGSGSDSDDETLASRIARLRREAEEVKLELAKKDDGEFKDSVEQQQGPSEEDSLEELSKLIHGLEASPASMTNGKKEDEFIKSLSTTQTPKPEATKTGTQQPAASIPPSTTSALATFADRLTALESALGLPSVSTSAPSILPTLETLSAQLSNLTTTLAPTTRPSQSQSAQSNATPNLDALQARVRALTVEADKLAASRRTALASLSELHDARMRFSQTRHSRDRPTSGATSGAAGATSPSPAPNNAGAMDKTEAGIHSDLFLSEHASKITALYQVLPSITELQPLLPVVLERLRSLSVIHAGAAEARGELDDVVRRQGEMREEVKRWRTAVEETEQRMGEVGGEMKRNVEVVGGMVRGCEEKVLELQKQKS